MQEPFYDKTLCRPLFFGDAAGGVENVELIQLFSKRLDDYRISHAFTFSKITYRPSWRRKAWQCPVL